MDTKGLVKIRVDSLKKELNVTAFFIDSLVPQDKKAQFQYPLTMHYSLNSKFLYILSKKSGTVFVFRCKKSKMMFFGSEKFTRSMEDVSGVFAQWNPESKHTFYCYDKLNLVRLKIEPDLQAQVKFLTVSNILAS